MKNFPERLKSARKMNSFSMQDLSDRLDGKISKQAIGRYEKGLMKPSPKNLYLLCRALGVKSDFFSRQISVELMPDISYRKLERLPVKKQEEIKEKTIDYLERYIELEEILGLENKFKNPVLGLKISDYPDVEKAAEVVRSIWNLGDEPFHNIVELIEEKGIKVIEIETDEAFSGMSAKTNNGHRVIVLNKISSIPIDRKRFTALHELGHHLLDLEKFKDDKKTEELMCHYFAGAMLLSKGSMNAELGGKRKNVHLKELILIKEQYGISMQAILYRAKNLAFITDNHFRDQMTMFGRLNIRKVEPGEFCGNEHSTRFFQLTIRAVAEGFITTSKAAALFNVKVAEFRKELNQFE